MSHLTESERSLEHETVRANPPGVARIVVVLCNDDPSACSDVGHERRGAELFGRYGCPQTLGIIPFCSGEETSPGRLLGRSARKG